MVHHASKRVTLARILRARGRMGEVTAEILTDFPERLTTLREVILCDSKGAVRPATVRKCWLHRAKGAQVAIFHFEGVDSISEAEKLAGLEVQIPFSERMPLSAGKYYVSDLTGCEVWEQASPPTKVGVVREVQLDTGTPVLVVDTPRGELLIPLAEEICPRIDTAARRIEVVLPEGLRDLNV